jgi:fatty acid desaturase
MADEPLNHESADPEWFRPPSVREHRIAGVLFVAFGVFFALLFFVLSGWWFRWVILILAGISIVHGIRHAIDSRRAT